MIAKLLLPLAVTLTGAAAQFGSAVSVSATFKNEDQVRRHLLLRIQNVCLRG